MARRISILITIVLLAAFRAAPNPAVLVVGDSWAAGIVGFRAFEQVLTEHGHTGVDVVGATTALGGSRADQWASNHDGKLDILRAALDSNPSIEVVHISIGGNDFLRAAMERGIVTAPPDARERMWEQIWSDIETLLRAIRAVRPDVHVLLNDYDYLDPELMTKTFSLKFPSDVNAENLNQALVELAKYKREKVRTTGLCEYLQHFGLLQYHYGFPPHLDAYTSTLPGMPPEYTPFAGGKSALANSPEAMPDGVHPMPEGYAFIIERCYEAFYRRWLAESADLVTK